MAPPCDGGWRGPALRIAASLAAFACVAGAVDRDTLAPPHPARVAPSEEPAILGAIHDYQVAYQDFYATGGDPSLLDAIPATKATKHQIFRDIGFLRDAGLVLVQDLATTTLLEATVVAPGTAEVLVFEEWNWTLQRKSDRKLVSEVRGLGQGFRYRVARESGRWVVASWDVEDVPAPTGVVENW